jgi:hypothetical protein
MIVVFLCFFVKYIKPSILLLTEMEHFIVFVTAALVYITVNMTNAQGDLQYLC